ncbi:hypothetical protein CLV45_3164 [Hymenobacter chitinivorans DSM 11115]|uniref:Outer membrane protein with beta-barrel domain n=2 Tax=Hymenobacter chitinivorans TaxID=89969 RepID=A0A2M9BA46_9BACT|nr:hypothetical protein CLV45_3164 [Hymenobacter chitinivorans DSM 11115]
MSDEELDALFQRSAENYPDEHNLSAWLQMERKLDEAAAGQLVRQRVLRIFLLEAVVVLVALLGWLGYSHYTTPETTAGPTGAPPAVTATAEAARSLAQPTAPTVAPAPAVAAARPQLATPPEALAARVALPASTEPATAASPTLATPATANPSPATRFTRPGRRALIGSVVLTPTRPRQPIIRPAAETSAAVTTGQLSLAAAARRETTLAPSPKAASPDAEQAPPTSASPAAGTVTVSVRPPVSGSSSPGSDSEPTGTAASVAPGTAVAAATQPGSEPLPSRPSGATLPTDSAAAVAPVVEPSAAPAPLAAPADSAKQPEKPARVKPAYRLSIGGLYAPELSTVGWTKTTSPGSNLGVVVEYRFTDRLRLNVAAIRSVKRYVARGSDYTVPAGTWSGNYTIDDVGAVCRITDVPINLRYDVLHRPQAALFVSAGLTSLLMRDEQYTYNYQYYGKYYSRDWQVKNGSNHWLSVVNLSAGYERSLASRWSVQAEPYVKVPLGGVGFGQVKLSSAGVFFSLKYHLLPTTP